MAANSGERRNLPTGFVFRPNGRELIEYYLVPKAFRGDIVSACHIADGVEVFSASPDALPLYPSGKEDEASCGYFFGTHPSGERAMAPGGCWLLSGPEKAYRVGNRGEVLAFRRMFVFHAPLPGAADVGAEIWSPTRWQIKEYRLNKGATAYRGAHRDPRANMDCVIRKVFAKLLFPPPPPSEYSSDQENTGYKNYRGGDEEARGYAGEGQPTKRARFA